MNITQRIIEKIEQGRNILITGSGGTGKSYQMNKIIEHFQQKKRIVATASTGTAATHLNGITADRFFGTMGKSSIKDLKNIMKSSEHWEKAVIRICNTDIVIIDEISMIRSDKLDLIDLICRTVRRNAVLQRGQWEVFHCENNLKRKVIEKKYSKMAQETYNMPFGGLQIIFSGDFLQIPPVVRRGEEVQVNDYGEQEPWAFQAISWKAANPFVIHLTEIKRQSDEEFISALQSIRMGKVTPYVDRYIKQRQNHEKECEIKLFSRNDIVNQVNDEKLSQVEGEEIQFNGSYVIHHKLEEDIDAEEVKRLCIIMNKCTLMLKNLRLKKGCKVICLTNNDKQGYVNGSIGTFVRACNFIELYGDNGPKKKYEMIDELLESIGENDPKNPWYEYIGDNLAIYSKKAFEIMKKNFKYHTDSTGALSERNALIVKLKCGRRVFVEKTTDGYMSGELINEENEIEYDIQLSQFPVKLAYALTIHKSQGMTLDEVEIDFNNCFADGSAYVALSRCKSYDGLYVKNWRPFRVKANTDALIFYNNLSE
jgi:nucleoside-triphosphatase THEP1